MKHKLKVTLNAPVTLCFVALCFVAMLLGKLTGGATDKLLFMTYRASPGSPLTYIRLFTHVLGHSGWEHFISNTSFLLLLGPMLEEKYGSDKILKVILITALITGLANTILFPTVALCGASGVVFAFILLTSFAGFREGEIPITFILVAAIYIGREIYEGAFVRDNVSNLTHIIGGVVGSVLGYVLNKAPSADPARR